MKKKIRILLFGLVFAFMLFLALPANVNAEALTITTLEQFSAAAQNGGEVKLGADITATANTFVRQPLDLDLNGYTLDMGSKTIVPYAELTIRDTSDGETGKITSTGQFTIQMGSSTLAGNVILESGTIDCKGTYGVRVMPLSTFTMNGGTITGKSYVVYGQGKTIINGGKVSGNGTPIVQVHTNSTFEMNGGFIESTGSGIAVNFYNSCSGVINDGTIEAIHNDERYNGVGIMAYKNTEVTINGGTITAKSHALAGNGSDSGNSEGTNAKFNINGGTLTSIGSTGIYAPQVNGLTTITGGTITGAMTGVEIRAGKLEITGGTISGALDEYYVNPNDNGLTTSGSAISIKQHTTKQPIEVVISGGTFYGYRTLTESNPLGNSAEDVSKISYDISYGVFHSTGDKTVDVEDYSEGFIYGGYYTHWVTPYVKDGYGEKPEDNMIVVYKWRDVSLSQTVNGSTTITRNKTTFDDGETILTEPDMNSESAVRSLKYDEIYLIPTPSEDCAYLYAEAFDSQDNPLEVDQDKIMYLAPDDDSHAVVHYVKMISREIDPTVEVNSIDIGVKSKAETNQILLNALKQDTDLFNLAASKDPTIELVIDEKEMTAEERAEIINKIGNDTTNILKLYDIYVKVTDKDGNELGRIEEVPEDIEFIVVLPNDVATVKDKYTRTYYVTRDNNGHEIINHTLSQDGRSISFKSNLSTTYSVSYVEERRVTVIFDSNEGTGTMENEVYLNDEEKELTENAFERKDYNFTGWNTKADGTGTSYEDKQVLKNIETDETNSLKLYAQWDVRKYKITFESEGEVIDIYNRIGTNPAGELPEVDRDNYVFVGWAVNGELIDEDYVPESDDVVAEAVWELKPTIDVTTGGEETKTEDVKTGDINVVGYIILAIVSTLYAIYNFKKYTNENK